MAASGTSSLSALTKLVVLLPYRFVAALLGGLAWLLSWLPLSIVSAHRHIVINCLACFPELSYAEVRKLARRSLVETARTLIRFPYIWQQDPAKSLQLIRTVHGREAVQAAMANNKPVILLSLHQSCWELEALEISRLGNIMILYKPGSPIDPFAIAGREACGCTTVPATGKGIRELLAGMKAGRSLCVLADHPPNNPQNPCVKFFNQDVIVPGFFHRLVKDFSPAIFYISVERVAANAYDIVYEPATESMHEMDEIPFLQQMMDDIETIIRRAPEQYNWAYNRFRSCSNGRRYWYKRRNAMAIIRGAAKGEDINQLLEANASRKASDKK